jgi:macrolide-specific efflux system membrane fusion protein
MKGKGKITTGDQGERLAVPVKALREEADGTYTVRVKGAEGKEAASPVTVGAESNGMIVVLSGLEEGQIVITPDEPVSK